VPRYRLAIFDLDGTLSDSFPWFLRVLNDVADRHGFRRVADSEIGALRGLSTRELIASLRVPFWKIPAIARDMRAMKAQALDTIPLFPGTQAMLQGLRRAGVTLALVSSDHEGNARRALRDTAPLFAHRACGASLFGKAAHFHRVLKATNIAPHEAIAIGDETRDAEAAARAGIAFGAVTWGYASAQALAAHAPQETFRTMDEIAARLA
jgi:phosphoglycolate phosphatase